MVAEDEMGDKLIVGIDVAKHWLDIAIAGRAGIERIDNTAEAIGGWLDRRQPALVAFEPTGDCARACASAASCSSESIPMRSSPSAAVAASKPRPTASTPG